MEKYTPKQYEKSLKPGPLFFERIIFRKPAGFFLPYVAKSKIHPDQISIISFIIGLGGIFLVGLGDYFLQIGGGFLLLLSNLVDCFDGEIARLKNIVTKYGGFMDAIFDDIKEGLIFFALASNYFIRTKDLSVMFLLSGMLFVMFLSYVCVRRIEHTYGLRQKEVRKNFTAENKGVVGFIAKIFSEVYPSSAVWVIIFIGLILNQTIFLFYFFIFTRTALFFFLVYFVYVRKYEDLKNK